MATVSSVIPRALEVPRSRDWNGPIERDFPRHASTGWPLTIHYWLVAYAWALGVLAIAGLFWIGEYFMGVTGTLRGTGDTGRLAVRLMGFAHYTVALYFLFTRVESSFKRNRTVCRALPSVFDSRVVFGDVR